MSSIVVRRHALPQFGFDVIELPAMTIDYGKRIEEVASGPGFRRNEEWLTSSHFPPIAPGKIESVGICLLRISTKEINSLELVRNEIARKQLEPAEFPVLDPLKEHSAELQKLGVGVIVTIGKRSSINDQGDTGHIGCYLEGRFGMIWDSYGYSWIKNDMYFAFTKPALAQLLSHN